ncbi:MAG: hypothetical protein L6R41_006988 [Letrouitia leprolyta]|nr:MAG: hypothetical protein L6R41_006988 [Letrouitia leprolyta]
MPSLRHFIPSPPRTPLQDTTNSMRSEPSSPPFHTAKTSQSTKPRHRFPISFWRHQNLDSSESIPSPHSSLWDAPLAEQTLNTTIPIGTWNAASSELPPPPPPPAKPKSNKKGKRKARPHSTSPPAAIESSGSLRLDPNIHHPHLLDTITERSSRPTLRSFHHSIPSLRQHSPSISTLRARSLALHKESFSLTDLPAPAPRALGSSSEGSASMLDKISPPTIHEPQFSPPERMPTPPGLPRFNTPEAVNYRLPSPHASLRDKIRRRQTPEQIAYRRQTSHLPPGVVMRGENGELIRGRWRRGGLSGHTGYGTQGDLETHPFNRAPMAAIASEGDDVVVRSEDTTHMGIGPAEVPISVYRRGSRWERFVEMTCFVCCGVEMASDGQVVSAVPRRSGDEGGGQEAMMTGARPVGEPAAGRMTGFQRVRRDGWMY